MSNSGFIWMGNFGCLLPFLIVFNFFFGRLIFSSTRMWLSIEAVLILIFIIKINIMANRIKRHLGLDGRNFASDNQSYRPGGKVVDVQGHVVKEDKKLK
jgi:FtsH-binding integral membrane protein